MCSQLVQKCSCFHASVERREAETVLCVAGDLDMAAVPLLGAAVREACSGPTPVVIEARGVTFVDAAGLRGLTAGYDPEVMAQVRVRSASPSLARLLEMVGMLDLLEGADR